MRILEHPQKLHFLACLHGRLNLLNDVIKEFGHRHGVPPNLGASHTAAEVAKTGKSFFDITGPPIEIHLAPLVIVYLFPCYESIFEGVNKRDSFRTEIGEFYPAVVV